MNSFPHSKNVKRFGTAIHAHALGKHMFQETDVPVLGHSRSTQRIRSAAECQLLQQQSASHSSSTAGEMSHSPEEVPPWDATARHKNMNMKVFKNGTY
jgi:hypothetical protein